MVVGWVSWVTCFEDRYHVGFFPFLGINSSAQSLRMLVGMPSGTGALVGSRFLRANLMSSSSSVTDLRLSSTGGWQCGMWSLFHGAMMLLKKLLNRLAFSVGSNISWVPSIR